MKWASRRKGRLIGMPSRLSARVQRFALPRQDRAVFAWCRIQHLSQSKFSQWVPYETPH